MDDALAESERHAATQARMHEASRWRLAALAADATCEAHLAGEPAW